MRTKITKYLLYVLLLVFILPVNSLHSQTVGINNILVIFETPPSSYTLEKTTLRYNKNFALGMHMDDGAKDIYTHAFPLLNGGVISGTNYPGLYYTDGCGNDISFKMSSSIFSFEQDGDIDGHDPDGPYASLNVTWPELIEMYENGWGVFNHGLTASSTGNYYYLIKRNQSYIKRKMLSATPGGPELKVFVCPNGSNSFVDPSLNQGYIVPFREFSLGVPSFNVTDYPFGDSIKMGRTELSGTVSLADMADQMANQSINGAHHFGSTFNHSVTGGSGYTFNAFKTYMEYIESTYGKEGLDNIWMTTEEEILEYLMLNRKIEVNHSLVYKTLIIELDTLEALPTDYRYYATSLKINADAEIQSIVINGGTNNSFTGIGSDSALINLEWDGYVLIPDTINAETYVSIAENTQAQTDWNIAMDYVEIVSPGPAKEKFRDRLCAIPGIVSPDGYCFCTTDAGPDESICSGDCIELSCASGEQYLWSTGDTTQNIEVCPVNTTTYYVTVWNSIGCPATDSVLIEVSPYPDPEVSNDTTICSGSCIDLFAGGGDSYEWSTGDTTQIIQVCPETNTTYYITISNESGCSVEDSVAVNVIPSPTAYAGPDTSLCQGNCINLTATGGDTYLWSTGDTTQTIEVCPQTNTEYIVTASYNNGCSDNDSIYVLAYPIPEIVISNDTTICAAHCIELSASGGYKYLWSNGDTSSSIVVCPEDTTTYYVTVYNQFECEAEDSVTVNTLPSPATNAGNDVTICNGECTVLEAEGAETYLWNTGDTSQNIEVCPEDSTLYYVTGYIDNGCSLTDSVNVFVNPTPEAVVSNDTTVCSFSTLELFASGGTAYEWSTLETTPTIIVTPEDTTIYYVKVLNDYGCFDKDSIIVNTWPSPDPTINSGNDTSICIGDCILLSVKNEGEILWSTGETANEITVCPENDTTYYVYIGNEYDCRRSDSIKVYVHELPQVIAGPDTSLCAGDSVVLSATGGDTYLWSTEDTTSAITVFPVSDSIFSVIAFDDIGCYATSDVEVLVYPLPDIVITPDTGVCRGECITLSASGGSSYLWDNGATTSSITICPEEARAYYVEVSYDQECSVIDSIQVQIYEVSNPDLPADTSSCQYDCIYLVAHNGVDYLWNTGDTNDSLLICIEDEEKFWVDITNENGCKSSDTTKIIPVPSTEAYIYDLIPAFCNYDDSVKLHGYPFGGEFLGVGVSHAGNDYYFNPENVEPGTHSLIYAYTNEFECTYNDTATLWVFERPFVDLGADTTVCNNDMLTLSAPDGFDSYLWSNGSLESNITFIPEELGTGLQVLELIVTLNGCVYKAERNLDIIICNPGINEYGNAPEIILYPVPAKNILYIDVEEYYQPIHYVVVDMLGKKIERGSLTNISGENSKDKISVSNFHDGMYMLILSGPDFISTKKFMVEKLY